MLAAAADYADIQGLVHSGYPTLTEAQYLLLRVADRDAARAWLGRAPVTSAAERNASRVLQLAFGVGGLRALGVPEPVVAGFAPEFLSGMTGSEGRSRRLGDVGANAPSRWRWGAQQAPDLLAVLMAKADLAGWRAQLADDAFRRGFAIVE